MFDLRAMSSATVESPFWLNLDPKTSRARLHVGTCSHAIEKGERQGTEKPVGSVVSRSQGGWVPFPDIEAARRVLAANWPKLTLFACRNCLRETVPPEAPLASDLDYSPTEITSVTIHRVIRDSDHSRYIKPRSATRQAIAELRQRVGDMREDMPITHKARKNDLRHRFERRTGTGGEQRDQEGEGKA